MASLGEEIDQLSVLVDDLQTLASKAAEGGTRGIVSCPMLSVESAKDKAG